MHEIARTHDAVRLVPDEPRLIGARLAAAKLFYHRGMASFGWITKCVRMDYNKGEPIASACSGMALLTAVEGPGVRLRKT
jgi:hypothetical protein